MDREKREQDIKQGKAMRSGREMFMFNPDLFVDEEDVMDTSILEPEDDDEAPAIVLEATGTSISARVIRAGNNKQQKKEEKKGEEGGEEEEADGDEEEDNSGGEDENGKEEEEDGVAVNEDLFVEEDIPDDV